jgi:DNA replication protein
MFEGRTTEELMRIAACGGGFSLKAGGRTTEDLMRIAAAASGKSARITFQGLAGRTTEDLMRIAAVGKGCVEFGE